MRIVCLSDTHRQHGHMLHRVPEGDVLVHAGDMCMGGQVWEIEDTAKWLAQLPHPHKVVIAGNHDWPLVRDAALAKNLLKDAGIMYLEDSEVVIDGVKFYGSPWTPMFFNWAFMKNRGKELAEVWAKIPEDVKVLITHGPPYGVLDRTLYPTGKPDTHAGCEDLTKELLTHRIRPKLHVFGHIHYDYGVHDKSVLLTTFVNAAICNEEYEPVHKPIVIDL